MSTSSPRNSAAYPGRIFSSTHVPLAVAEDRGKQVFKVVGHESIGRNLEEPRERHQRVEARLALARRNRTQRNLRDVQELASLACRQVVQSEQAREIRRRGLTPHYVPPVSLVLAGEAQTYIKGLTSYRYGDPEDWYAIFADALATASERAREFADRVAALQERWLEQAGNPRKDSGARKLIDALPAHPVVDVNSVQGLIGAKSQESARQAIIRLEEADLALCELTRAN